MMAALRIVLLAIVAAVAYGVIHDQFTARLCVEYFTIGHPPIFGTDDPTILGIGWGIIATWWVGLLLGVPLAIAAHAGRRPKVTVHELQPMIFRLLTIMAFGVFVAAVLGWQLAAHGIIVLTEPLAALVPADKHVAFLTAGAAHLASYAFGFFGGIVLMFRVRRMRFHPETSED